MICYVIDNKYIVCTYRAGMGNSNLPYDTVRFKHIATVLKLRALVLQASSIHNMHAWCSSIICMCNCLHEEVWYYRNDAPTVVYRVDLLAPLWFVTDNHVVDLLHTEMSSIQRDTCISFANLSQVQIPTIHHVYFAPIYYQWYENLNESIYIKDCTCTFNTC